MTKFDIRLRRNQFTQSRIEGHKNFQNLLGDYDKSGKKRTRGIMVLVILLILVVALLLALFNKPEVPKQEQQKEKLSYHTALIQSESTPMTQEYKLKSNAGAPKSVMIV